MTNEYIFYTTEGHTSAPNDNIEVENCQVLGTVRCSSESEAQEHLLNENSWITEAGFDPTEFLVRQILTNEQRNDINVLVDYLWADEERHFEESEDKENHIFNVLKRLKELYEIQDRNK